MTIEKPRTEAAAPDEQAEDRPEKKAPAINVPGLLAGAATAATMSVIGGHLSVVGTVLGAALTSIVSGVAVVVYSTSLEKSRSGLKKVRTVVSRRTPSPVGPAVLETHGSGAVTAGSRWSALRPRLKPFLVSTGVILGLAVAAVFGVQALTGTELSGGTGTIQRSVTGENSVAVRSAGINPPGTQSEPGTTGVVPADGSASTQEEPADAPLPADGLPTGAASTGTGDGTTTSGGELPASGGQQSNSGVAGTGTGQLGGGAPAQPGTTGTDTGAAPAVP